MKIMKSPVLTRIVFQPFFCYYFVYDAMGAHSSAWLERYLDMVEVIGSSPIEPTITKKKYRKRKSSTTLYPSVCETFTFDRTLVRFFLLS